MISSFDTPGPISATVDIVLGDIRFIASDRADTVVEVRPVDPSWELDVKAAEQADVEFADGKLVVKHPKLRNLWATRYGTVHVRVELPTGSDVQGDTAKGDYLVEGVVGSCRLKTPTGNIRVEQATDVRLRTTGGRVTVDHVTGQADVRGNGDIRLRRVDGGAVVKNILGDIRVGEIGSGTVDLYTATGDVEVGVPQGTAARLDAHTSAGRVRNHLEAPEQSDRTVEVRARSNGGDIVVRRAMPETSTVRAS